MKFPKVSASVIFLLMEGVTATGTTIFAIRTPDGVVIAADSLGTFRGGNTPTNTQPVCKIYSVSDIFFGVAGVVRDPVTGFSQSYQHRGTIQERVAFIEERFRLA